jgi:hypothetical protein
MSIIILKNIPSMHMTRASMNIPVLYTVLLLYAYVAKHALCVTVLIVQSSNGSIHCFSPPISPMLASTFCFLAHYAPVGTYTVP